MAALAADRVPDSWAAVGYPSLRTLGSWMHNLLARVAQIQEWTGDLTVPKSVNLSYLFNPQSFLTAIKQTTARRNEWALDKTVLITEVGWVLSACGAGAGMVGSRQGTGQLPAACLHAHLLHLCPAKHRNSPPLLAPAHPPYLTVPTALSQNTTHPTHSTPPPQVTKKAVDQVDAPSRDGAYVHGLVLEGAGWDDKGGVLEESRPKQLLTPMPVMLMRAVPADKVRPCTSPRSAELAPGASLLCGMGPGHTAAASE